MFKSKWILFWSPEPDKLVKFYTDVLGLELVSKTDLPPKYGMEKDYGYTLKLSEENVLWIGHHSEVPAVNADPFRHMLNLDVDDLMGWYQKVKDAGCEIVQEPNRTPMWTEENPRYVCTWLDPEKNCWQFFGSVVEEK